MRLSDILNTEQVTISCELFPPKQGAQLENYKKIVAGVAALKPAYMSVTYGATGGTSDYTVELANEVRNVNHIPVLAHLTCASSTKEKVASVIRELKEKKIENILALRGDIPEHADFPLPDQYHHASELIAEIRAQGDCCIGGACYPEGHPESESIFTDLDHLKEKVDAGCEFLTTQMFFDNNILYSFMYKALKKGINDLVRRIGNPRLLHRRRIIPEAVDNRRKTRRDHTAGKCDAALHLRAARHRHNPRHDRDIDPFL